MAVYVANKSDDPSVRHMGPMAQDFKVAFGLGDTGKAYHSVDAHGVALAAIQALYERLEKQNARLDQLERDNDQLRTRCK
jgi:ribosomal protein L9